MLGRTFVPVKSPHFSSKRGTFYEFCGHNRMLSQLSMWDIEMNRISCKAKYHEGLLGPGLQNMYVNVCQYSTSNFHQSQFFFFFGGCFCLVKQNHIVPGCVRGVLASPV